MPIKERLSMAMNKTSTKIFSIMLVCLLIFTLLLFYTGSRYRAYIHQELTDRTIAQLQKSEDEIYVIFQRMVNIANVICNDESLQDGLEDPARGRYENTLVFNTVVNTIEVNNLYDMTDIKITLCDERDNVYANWSTNYHNYQFLYQQPWVQESIAANGYVRWNMFAPSFIIEEGGKTNYISLAKSLLSSQSGHRLGTLIVSLEQSWLSQSLRQFFCTPSDMIYICTEDGTPVLHIDDGQAVGDEKVRQIMEMLDGDPEGSKPVPVRERDYLLVYYTLSRDFTFNGEVLKVLHFTDYDNITHDMDRLSAQVTYTMLLCIPLFLLFSYLISKALTRPIELLSGKMLEYLPEQEVTGLDFQRKDEIGQVNRAFQKMSETIQTLYQKQREESAIREQYRFESLRAQVNPHFLFNTLNTIRWMAIIRKADNIVACIDALATMMEYSMNRGGELVDVGDEIANIESYIYINNCRYGNQFQFKHDIPEEVLHLQVIKFILQPIVENAVIHGFKGQDKRGTIMLYGDIEGDVLKLCVEDNGTGISEETIQQLNRPRNEKKVTGIGIANVDARIKSSYGNEYGITVCAGCSGGTVVEYRLPILRGETDHA